MHGAYSETWWWQCPYVGLHECCWCRGILKRQVTYHSERSFTSQLVQFGASERVSRVNWFSSGLQSAFRESICVSFGSVRGFRARFASQMVQFGASERVS